MHILSDITQEDEVIMSNTRFQFGNVFYEIITMPHITEFKDQYVGILKYKDFCKKFDEYQFTRISIFSPKYIRFEGEEMFLTEFDIKILMNIFGSIPFEKKFYIENTGYKVFYFDRFWDYIIFEMNYEVDLKTPIPKNLPIPDYMKLLEQKQ